MIYAPLIALFVVHAFDPRRGATTADVAAHLRDYPRTAP
jgi:hypothetical protein